MKASPLFHAARLASLALLPLLGACTSVEIERPAASGSSDNPPTTSSAASGSVSSGSGGNVTCDLAPIEDYANFSIGGLESIPSSRLDAVCTATRTAFGSMQLLCSSETGEKQTIYLEAPGWMRALEVIPTSPSNGTVFLHAVQNFVPFFDSDNWFEIHAGSDRSGPLLLAGLRGQTVAPPGEAAESWYAPLSLEVDDPGCAESPWTTCAAKRPLVLKITPRDGGAPIELHGGDLELEALSSKGTGPFDVLVGAAEQHRVTEPEKCPGSDEPLDRTDLRVLIVKSILGD